MTHHRTGSGLRAQIIIILILFLLLPGCKNTVVNPAVSSSYDLCYQKAINYQSQILLNNSLGTNPRMISSSKNDDENPRWSPDGNFIAFDRSYIPSPQVVCLYDVANDKVSQLTPDSLACVLSLWSPDNRLAYFAANRAGGSEFSINPDGSNMQKIYAQPTFFFRTATIS
jgi:Tol biopolymer transport system component